MSRTHKDLRISSEAMHAHAGAAARLLKALGNEKRLQVMCALVPGECSVGGLNERIDLSQSALSQHLAVLREQGLVATRRASQTIYYRIADPTVEQILKVLHNAYCGSTSVP